MIDWHCHILPGIDDGPLDVSDSIIMATRLADFGFDTVCCTPHCIKGYYDHTPQQVREATLRLQADLDSADIQLSLWPGMEYCLDECFADYVEDLLPLGDTRLILCEAPQQANPDVVQQGLQLIVESGHVPLIAHPERSDLFSAILLQRARAVDAELRQLRAEGRKTRQEDVAPAAVSEPADKPRRFWGRFWPFSASRLESVSGDDGFRFGLPEACLYQTNLGSFSGYYGLSNQQRAYTLLKAGVFQCLASDLHDSHSCSQVLNQDKLTSNPLLQGLAEWRGVIPGSVGEASLNRQLSLEL